MDKKTISLCMIVKNEADFIGNCLDGIRDTMDEIIIVDTGSTDGTQKICEAKGAKVFPYQWKQDFSAARNYGLEKASSEWILWLDADEEVEQGDLPHLRKFLHCGQEKHVFSIKLINFHGESPPHPDRSFLIAHHRIFRNHRGFRFLGPIHEQLNIRDVLPEFPEVPMLPIRVYHYGYMESVTGKKEKFKRNLQMLEKALEGGDPNPWIPYHIASEYYRVAEYRKSFEYVNQSIIRFIKKGETPPSLLYKLKYAVLLLLGSIDGAYPGIERAIALYPNYVDLHFYKGIILFAKEKYEQALDVFHHCLTLGEENLEHLILCGLGSFQAWYYIGECERKHNRLTSSLYAFAQSLCQSPTYEPSWKALYQLAKNHTMEAHDPLTNNTVDWKTAAGRQHILEKIENYALSK